MRADTRQGGHGAFDFFLGEKLQRETGLWTIRFGDDVDDAEDVDVAGRGEVFASDEGRANGDEVLAFVGVFGNLEGEGFDGSYGFEGVEVVS